MTSVPQFWHISFPIYHPGGMSSDVQVIGHDESSARHMARMWSRSQGHATVTNREGLVATYVEGREWFSEKDTQARTS